MSFKKNLYRGIQKFWLARYQPRASMPAHTLDCPECGQSVTLPKLRQGREALCPSCGHHLTHIESEPYLMPLATSIAAMMLMIAVQWQPFLTVHINGIAVEMNLMHTIATLLKDEWGFLGIVMAVLIFVFPLLFCLSAIYVYTALMFERKLPFLQENCRLMTRLRQWIMADVFFVSVLIAYIKISNYGTVTFQMGFWLLPLLALLLLRTSVAVSDHWMFFQIAKLRKENFQAADEQHICCTRCLHFRPATEHRCGICGSELFNRRPYSLSLSSAFLFAATLLYLPANLLPIMITANPMNEEISTIMSGIILMWQDDPLIAAIIFSASIAVPTLKIISLAILIYSAKFRPLFPIPVLSWQYRITEAIGRWSMIDIFVIIVLMSIFHSNLARVTPGPAAIYFCLVVVLTMISAYFFDPRLIWDKHAPQTKQSH